MATKDPPLEEIEWRSPIIAQSMGGIQKDSGKQSHLSRHVLPRLTQLRCYSFALLCTITLL
jgi:hypothetical protein